MSASVIRRGLALFSEKDGVKLKQRKSSGKSALMDQISTEKQRVRRRIRQLQRPGRAKQSTNTVKDKHIRSAVDEYRKKSKKSHLRSNLKYFLSSNCKTQNKHTTKVVQQNASRRACHRLDPPRSKVEEKSVFTEEEFQKFQREYFSKL